MLIIGRGLLIIFIWGRRSKLAGSQSELAPWVSEVAGQDGVGTNCGGREYEAVYQVGNGSEYWKRCVEVLCSYSMHKLKNVYFYDSHGTENIKL